MSEMKNPLFDDLETRNKEQTTSDLVAQPEPKQLVSTEEMSQIRKRQLALKEEPQVQELAKKLIQKSNCSSRIWERDSKRHFHVL